MLLLMTGLGHLGIQLAAGIFQLPPGLVASQLPMAAPIPKSMAEVAHRKAVDELMCEDSEPWSSRCGYPIFDDGDSEMVNERMAVAVDSGPHKPGTYGEVTTTGARQLFYHMGMSRKEIEGDDRIVFMDMGSGVGKLVVQAFMEVPRISHAIGIELAPLRHQHALSAWQELEIPAQKIRISRDDMAPIREATLELLEGDIFEADISRVTHLYVASLCFSNDMMHRLATKLEQEANQLQCIATIRCFPPEFKRRGILDHKSHQVVMKTLGMIERFAHVDMSWTAHTGRGCEVVIYTKP